MRKLPKYIDGFLLKIFVYRIVKNNKLKEFYEVEFSEL